MLTIFLCFAGADRATAESIAMRLEATAEVNVVLDEVPEHTLPMGWEGGAASAGIVLLLSPVSVPVHLSRDDWAGLLRHVETHAEPPIASVLVRTCRFPRLLERNHFLNWDETNATLRALQQWALNLHSLVSGGFAPAPQPNFTGRKAELDRLWTSLIDQRGLLLISGAPRAGKTCLAQEFARQAQTFFRDVVWVSCGGRTRACIVSELASQLRLASTYSVEDSIPRIFEQHRLLAILDEIEDDNLVHKLRGGAASLLVTRSAPLPGVPILELSPFTGASPDFPSSPEQQALWRAMTVCRADQVPLGLAAAIAAIPTDRALELCRGLVQKRLVDPLDEASATYRLSRPAPIQDCEVELRGRHAQLVSHWFASNIAEAKCAFHWACEADWGLAVSLGKQMFSYLRVEGRSEESTLLLAQLEAAAERHGDSRTVEFARYELSWISDSPWARSTLAASVEQLRLDFAVETQAARGL